MIETAIRQSIEHLQLISFLEGMFVGAVCVGLGIGIGIYIRNLNHKRTGGKK